MNRSVLSITGRSLRRHRGENNHRGERIVHPLFFPEIKKGIGVTDTLLHKEFSVFCRTEPTPLYPSGVRTFISSAITSLITTMSTVSLSNRDMMTCNSGGITGDTPFPGNHHLMPTVIHIHLPLHYSMFPLRTSIYPTVPVNCSPLIPSPVWLCVVDATIM